MWQQLNAFRHVATENNLNATAYMSIIADPIHPFMITMYHLLVATHKAQIISN